MIDDAHAIEPNLALRIWRHPTTAGITMGSVVILAILSIIVLVHPGAGSLVPPAVQKRVNFPVYYPDPKKLPSGFQLTSSSFHVANAKNEAVVYTVIYNHGKKLVFTVQQKPSSDEIALFVRNYLPVHRQIETLAGTATIGAIGPQTVASIPTSTSAWILMTGPSDIYGTPQLSTILKSLTH